MTKLTPLLVVIAALALAACGEDTGSDDSAATATPTAEAAQSVASVDGFLLSATETEVVVRTQAGDQTFTVAPADVEAVGIPHLASHAGLTDIGFRVYYVEEGGVRYIKGSEEIAPPF